jgi:hypothetical protein
MSYFCSRIKLCNLNLLCKTSYYILAKRAAVFTPVSSSSSDNLGDTLVASFDETCTSMHEDETHDTAMHIDGIQGDSDQAVEQPRVLNNRNLPL